MQSYTYLARLRCIDGRDVEKSPRVTSAVQKNGCFEDQILVKCSGDPKWTSLLLAQESEMPKPPLGFRLISESGYIQYTAGLKYLQRGELALAAVAFDSATASDPDIALLHYMHGMALRRMGELLDAKRALERAVSLAPGALSYRMELSAVVGDDPVQLRAIERDATPDFKQMPELWCRIGRAEKDATAAAGYKDKACRAGYMACCR